MHLPSGLTLYNLHFLLFRPEGVASARDKTGLEASRLEDREAEAKQVEVVGTSKVKVLQLHC